MDNVRTIISNNMTPEQALRSAIERAPQEVLIIGHDGKGRLIMRSSKMSRKDSLWLVEAAKIEIMRELYDGDDEL